MITIQKESLTDNLPELKHLLPLHYEELALNRDKVPLSPQYDIYVAREERGELIYVTVREDSVLVGYFIGIIAPGLHYSTCLTCTMDIFYVVPAHRGSDIGFKLFTFVRKELVKRGVQRWYVGSKVHFDASWLFERLGMEKVETYYSEWIGE